MSYNIVVASNRLEEDSELLDLGVALCAGGKVAVTSVIQVPEDLPLSDGAAMAIRRRKQMDELVFVRQAHGNAKITAEILVGRNIQTELTRAVADEKGDFLLVGLDPLTPGAVPSRLLAEPPADLVLASGLPSPLRRILVAVRGGPNAELAIKIGGILAQEKGAELTVLHVFRDTAQPKNDPHGERAAVQRASGSPSFFFQTVLTPETPDKAITTTAANYDLLIVGAPAKPWDFASIQPLFTPERGTIVVKASQSLPLWLQKPSAQSNSGIDRWFAENTFSDEEFDPERLLTLKKRAGATISLGLPTLNEAETIGPIIETMQRALMNEIPLLDQIVCFDGGSDDKTPDVCRDLGVPVYRHRDILPAHGTRHGKGEALWKSLAVLSGDLVVWLDTDLLDPRPSLVHSLLGPLLVRPRLQYVKGYSSRALGEGDDLVAGDRARVTELTARPLLNLFFPELAGFLQPLSGQCAGRRAALTQMPFSTGHGVEAGLLIDLLERFGLPALGQVNLGHLRHRHRPATDLGPVSFAVLQTIVNRLERWKRLSLLSPVNRSELALRSQNQLSLSRRKVEETQRPPLVTLPEFGRPRG